jgi:hypothetical protein
MNLQLIIEQVKSMDNETQIEIKPFLITYTIYRKSNDIFEIDCTCGEWLSTKLTLKQLIKAIENNFLNINWK